MGFLLAAPMKDLWLNIHKDAFLHACTSGRTIPYPDKDLMFTKSLWPFKGVKRMQVDLANERKAWTILSLSACA